MLAAATGCESNPTIPGWAGRESPVPLDRSVMPPSLGLETSRSRAASASSPSWRHVPPSSSSQSSPSSATRDCSSCHRGITFACVRTRSIMAATSEPSASSSCRLMIWPILSAAPLMRHSPSASVSAAAPLSMPPADPAGREVLPPMARLTQSEARPAAIRAPSEPKPTARPNEPEGTAASLNSRRGSLPVQARRRGGATGR
mmetsp:Transcript_11829/g.46193  ORF Transcript_11829/g.46193 Transcript_11829/m.46193 type:complete len:202 (+) Transcript_11829:1272-1877(+)